MSKKVICWACGYKIRAKLVRKQRLVADDRSVPMHHSCRIAYRKSHELDDGPLFGSGQGRSSAENQENAEAFWQVGIWVLAVIAVLIIAAAMVYGLFL